MSARALVLLSVAVVSAADPLAVPFIRQRENGCGAASVAMVVRYWEKRDVAGQAYGRLYDPERKAILLSDMKTFLEESGYRVFTLRGAWDDVTTHIGRGRPLIVALRPGAGKPIHFAVVAGADERSVWLNDPTRGKMRRVKRSGFEQQWTLAGRWLLLATRSPS